VHVSAERNATIFGLNTVSPSEGSVGDGAALSRQRLCFWLGGLQRRHVFAILPFHEVVWQTAADWLLVEWRELCRAGLMWVLCVRVWGRGIQ
jgi:hypothetical protein